MNLTLLLFSVFVVVWFYIFNRYGVLYYQEQMQLFRFDRFYFHSFMDRPGGLSNYFGAFLVQFYYYPLAGAIILAVIITTVVWLFHRICQTVGEGFNQLFFIPFIPGVLLMTSLVNNFFDLSAALGILLVLAGFRWYIAMPLKVRYSLGLLLVTVTYFIAGGNSLLLMLPILFFETSPPVPLSKGEGESLQKEQIKKRNKLIYLLLLTGWTVLLPWLSRCLFYTVTMREAYFTLTPVTFFFPKIDSKLLWISIPILFLIVSLVTKKINRWNFSPVKAGVLNFLIVFVMTASCAYSMHNSRFDTINRMTFELQKGNFDSVIAAGEENPTNNRLICYLSNIALFESGQMPYRMFHYKQMGPMGLFLDWESSTATILVWYLGEAYYRLGLMLPAEHCAFETLILNQKECSVNVLQRLTLINIANRNAANANKYLRYLDHSLFYRKWVQQQRANLASAIADENFQIPDTPLPVHCKDFHIPYRVPEYTLLRLLEANPKHRMAFEYMMAYCMLYRDLENMKWCMDKYYGYFDYPAIPTHYEEALLLYKEVFNEGPDFFTQYPISNATRERYDHYMQAVQAAQRGGERKFEQFKKQFSNTFWFYMNLIDPTTLKK